MKKNSPTRPEITAAKAAALRETERFMALSDAAKTREAESAAKSKSRPLAAAERAMFDAMGIGRARGRPMKGRGARQISLTMERGLLSRVDLYVRDHGLSRAQFIARAVERALPAA